MRALVVTEPGDAQVRAWTDPEPREGVTLVAPLLVGMCGTDLELIDGTIDPAYVRYPLVLGHEWVGRLLQPIDHVADAGARVLVEGVIPCGNCEACARGDSNLCVTYDEIGFTRPGALADQVAVPTSLVHVLSDQVALDDAVFTEPMAVVWRALTRVPLRQGLRVAVIGDGTIALLSAHLVRLFQPSAVTVIGRRDEQRELALRAGATSFVTSTPAERYDLVIEAAGVGAAVVTAIDLAARGAMVILLGLPPHGTTIEVAPDDLVNNDVIIQASFSYTSRSFGEVVKRLNAGDVHPSFLITHRFSLEDAALAITTLRGVGVSEPRGKVVVAVSD